MAATHTKVGISQIGQIAINVHDIDRATAFYRDVLAIPFLFSAPAMAFFQCGNVRLMLALPEKPEFDHPSSIIYYRVDDIQASYRALGDRGVSFEGEPVLVHKTDTHELWMASFRDLDENLLALMSEVPLA